jgi:hypothetical protein
LHALHRAPNPVSELTMFLYPWDAAHDGWAATAQRLAALGVTRVAVAVAYHSAEVLTPRPDGPLVTFVEANRAHLRLPAGAFEDGALALPESAFAREHPGWPEDFASSCAEAGLGLTAWVVAFHNSELAQAHPADALENCAGDRSAHGLCPAAPRSREYLPALVRAVAATGRFDRVLLESASYLLAGHGHPHELAAVRQDVRTRLLLSLCFCPSCTAQGEARGLDVARLRERCRARLLDGWGSPLAGRRDADEGLEVAALLVEDPELAAYARMRVDVVSSLLGEVAAELSAAGIGLVATTAVWGRPAPLNWFEGIDLARTAEVADQLAVTTYARDAGAVARDLDVALREVPSDRVMQVNTLSLEHHATSDELLAKVQLGLDAGVRAFGLYNLAMAPPAVVGWTARVADLIAAS